MIAANPVNSPTAYELWGQRHTASVRRRDGHDIAGNPGDCFRCAIAYVWGIPADDVPHFGLRLSWWWEARRWTRWTSGGALDLYYVDFGADEPFAGIPAPDLTLDLVDPDLVVLGGPSPRGSWKHSIAGRLSTLDGEFDPHPSSVGLLAVTEAFVLRPALPWLLAGIPDRLVLPARTRYGCYCPAEPACDDPFEWCDRPVTV